MDNNKFLTYYLTRMIYNQIFNSTVTTLILNLYLVLNKNNLAAQKLFYSKPISHIVKCVQLKKI